MFQAIGQETSVIHNQAIFILGVLNDSNLVRIIPNPPHEDGM
jgi:hypothetical protein